MPIQQRPDMITTGAAAVKIVSETQGGCIYTGCLSRLRYGYSKNMRAVYCNILQPPIDFRPMSPGFMVDMSAKELTALNFAVLGGSGSAILTGADAEDALKVGDPTLSDSTHAAEFHIVKLTGAAPWDFTFYTEFKDLWSAAGFDAGDFIKGTDINIFGATPTSGDVILAPLTTLYEANALVGTASDAAKGSFYLGDPCSGLVYVGNMPDALIAQYVYSDSDPLFTINGRFPIKESNVRNGDTVGIFGISYFHSGVKTADGGPLLRSGRSLIEFPTIVEDPIALKIVHRYEKDPKRKAKIIRVPRMLNTSGFSVSIDPMSTAEHTLDATFQALDSSDIYPDSPMFTVEIIDADEDVTLESLL